MICGSRSDLWVINKKKPYNRFCYDNKEASYANNTTKECVF